MRLPSSCVSTERTRKWQSHKSGSDARGWVVPPEPEEVEEIVNTTNKLAQAIAEAKRQNDVLILMEHGLLAAQAIIS
jgi:hypothetical protein